jgi:hypothetical protein
MREIVRNAEGYAVARARHVRHTRRAPHILQGPQRAVIIEWNTNTLRRLKKLSTASKLLPHQILPETK